MKSTLLFLAPSLAAATVPAIFARGCGDNCARAVIAKAYTTRDGAGDCAAYMRTTVTPSAVTVTATVTDFFSVTSTELATETTLTTTTYASTDVDVVKETAHETVTVTSIAAALKKRDAEPTIPAYASACSGAVRYSTACACVGVTMVTITAETPTSTVTVSESTTASFSETTTVATEVIVSTTTSIESTTTTTTDATATATQTAVVAPAQFKLRSTRGSTSGKFLNAQLPEILGYYRSTLGFTSDASKAAVFSFSTPTGGQLSQVSGSKSFPLLATTSSNNPVVVANPRGAAVDTAFKPAVCTFTGAKVSCAWADSASTPRSWGVLPLVNTLVLGNPRDIIGATIELEIVAA